MNYLDIELKGINEEGKENDFKLSDFKGENIILYFYPKDDTPVCTKKANLFNEYLNKIKQFARIIGVSSDDIEEHKEFKKKYNLNFILLSDKENMLKKAIEEHHRPTSILHRATFILDKNGNIIKFWEKVDVDDHIEEIINFFEKELNI